MYFNDICVSRARTESILLLDRTRIDFIDSEVWGRAELRPCGFYTNPDNNQRVWSCVDRLEVLQLLGFSTLLLPLTLMNQPAGASYIDSLAVPSGY